jgi:hypothetical protein
VKIWQALTDAVQGWIAILRGDEAWRDHFSLTSAGLGAALAIFAFIAFLTVALASMSIGMPQIVGVVIAMLVLALPLVALVIALYATRALARIDGPVLPILVPGAYTAAAFLVVEGVVAIIGGPVVMLTWAAFGYLLYKLARIAAGWNLGIAAGFAVLTVLMLVVTRIALYMLTNTVGSPI